MKKIKFDNMWLIKDLGALDDNKFIETLLSLVNKRGEKKKIIGHYANNEIIDLDILDFDRGIQHNISSYCWQESLDFFTSGGLSKDQVEAVWIGENIAIAKYICQKTFKEHLTPELFDKITASTTNDKLKAYFLKIKNESF